MQDARRSHIIIAGTGRAGTTFLVQYLTELGLDTHISRYGPGQFDANAQAGFEDMPMLTAAETLPYVIKAPWMGQYIDEILASSEIQIDAAILPVRNLVEAAASRTILELRAMHQSAPQMAQLTETWENWALTPGGTIFSLNPLDQARILAIGFHRLVQRLVDAEIPILLLGFPRLIEDCDYLFERLKSLLPETVTPEQARVAHQRAAQRKKVRVGDELGSEQDRTFSAIPAGINYPDRDRLDRIALGREMVRLNQERAHDQTTIADLGRRVAEETSRAQVLTAQFEAQCLQTIEAGRQAGALAAELEAQRLRTAEAIRQAEAHTVELEAQRLRTAEAIRQAEALTVELEAQRLRTAEAIRQAEASLTVEIEAHRLRTAEAIRQAEALALEIDALRRSRSWRATAWLRWLSIHTVPRAS
jgi:hypothetical protein